MRITLTVLFGPIVWAMHFMIVYGVHASFCAIGWSDTELPTVPMIGITMLAFVVLALAFLRPEWLAGPIPADKAFLLSMTRWLIALSLIAVAASGLALLIVTPC